NDLQALSEGKKKLELRDTDLLTLRDSELKIFDVIARIFKTHSTARAREAVWESGEEPETILKWIAENLPREYEDKEDLARAFDYISRADVFMGRIMRRQDWGMLAYAVDMMSAGVATAKKKKYMKFTRYQYPQVFALYAKTKKERALKNSLAGKISNACYCSKRDAISSYIPTIEIIMNNNPEMGAKIASEINMEIEEIKFIVKNEALAEKMSKRAEEIRQGRIRSRISKVRQASLHGFST
ncbi:MAG: hypothetical protein ACE5NL_01600, partial [Candidatus Hydrothermarchaeaceae archaeon]